MGDIAKDDARAFIAKWSGITASELSTSQSFLIDLCALLGMDRPHPTPEQDYLFERPISFAHGDGRHSVGRIDLYRRGCFVLESKKLKASAERLDAGLLAARSQAENYARALPAAEGRPPFVVVVDVGRRIELYSEFSRSGATYTPFPDPRSHRLALEDLARPEIRDRLRKVWLDPLSLDPSRESARVTREIAARLATLAKSLEQAGHAAELTAQFLMRCLFTMFAEDVRLLPEHSFRDLLLKHLDQPQTAMRMLEALWQEMDRGGFSVALGTDVLRFNGKLFKNPARVTLPERSEAGADAGLRDASRTHLLPQDTVSASLTLPLDKAQLALLIEAAKADWQHVEPAIFGTLLERALSPGERHKLGAHYTPRAYVERLVLPTVIEPLRQEWSDAQAAALTLAAENGPKARDEAIAALRRFHHRLCSVRVLDPACGSGNFLYVTLEHLKRLEGEVLNALDELGYRQTGLALDGERADASEGETVDPHNLLGIELNPRAAAIAEVVLWIGYLQWHFRTRGNVQPPIPVIRDFRNIENRDAVLAYDAVEYVTDAAGLPVTRWDGVTMKKSPITGEDVPDDSARLPLERYLKPRKAAWPDADFVVGNPPFIGNKRMRAALGDGYAEALRETWTDVPESADFVMYWWHAAAQLTRAGQLRRFGLITTNSIRQAFNRRVIEGHLHPASVIPAQAGIQAASAARRAVDSAEVGEKLDSRLRGNDGLLSIAFAIPDHPWVDTSDGAAVRIGMTVAEARSGDGRLLNVAAESACDDGEMDVTLEQCVGRIHADLTTGAAVSNAKPLAANQGLALRGITLVGTGFVVTRAEAASFGAFDSADIRSRVRPFFNGRDLTQSARDAFVIDLFGLEEHEARARYPALYQRVHDRVKPERDQNARESYRIKWWVFAEPRSEFRRAAAGLSRYIVTTMTAKHRTFLFLRPDVLPDQGLVPIANEDAMTLGVLSCKAHEVWALSAGSHLGVGNDPRYNQSRCFDPFPFPIATDTQQARIRALAEHLDTHRKRQQAAHADLTLTGMYNVLEKLRAGEALKNPKERLIHEQGLVSVLRQLHDELDAAVLEAYGWSDLLPRLQIAHGNLVPDLSAAAVARTQSGNAAPSAGTGPDVVRTTTGGNDGGVRADPDFVRAAGLAREDARRGFDEAILERFVALNAERAAEEARGLIRWLRPEFQNPQASQRTPEQTQIDTGREDRGEGRHDAPAAVAAKPLPWPKDAVEQVRAVADALAASAAPRTLDEIAARFSGRGPWNKRLPSLLGMLVVLGRATLRDGRYSAGG